MLAFEVVDLGIMLEMLLEGERTRSVGEIPVLMLIGSNLFCKFAFLD